MKVEGKAIDYNSKSQLRNYNKKEENYSEFMEKGTNSHNNYPLHNSRNCSVNDLYNSMTWSWWGGVNESFTGIDIYNMPNCGASLYLSDDGSLTCIDDDNKGSVLWQIPVNKDGFNKILELMEEGKDFILKEKDVLERYLNGTIKKEDIQKLQDLRENHLVYENFFENCSEEVKEAWEHIQGSDMINRFNGNSDQKDYILTEIDKYMLIYLTNNVEKFDGSLENMRSLIVNVTDSLKRSLSQYSRRMQNLKLKELDVLEKFQDELEKY